MENIERNKSRIRFLGGAGTVTGSKYLLTMESQNILVDCGLFQGLKELRLKNWDRFPIDPTKIAAIVLTHAHIDHSGYIPRLIKEGFRGPIYCTAATFALCKILLPDTGYLQEEEASYLHQKKYSKHNPPLPLFTKKEAEESLPYFITKDFDQEFEVSPGIKAKFLYAGHILGASIAVIEDSRIKIAFSGDLGRPEDPIFFAPAKLPKVDYIVVESTYGSRRHLSTDPQLDLEKIIVQITAQKGVIMIPSFAVGRTQTLLFFLARLKEAGKLRDIPVFLNSPMATSATNIFYEFKELHRLSLETCRDMQSLAQIIETAEDSKALNLRSGPMIIISASGMATGGRILHHLKAFAPDPKNAIVLAGYQASGTRGRQMQDGATEVKILGLPVSIRAKVYTLENLSAHADFMEILDWLSVTPQAPKRVFITHGEPESALALKDRVQERLNWNCHCPSQDQEFVLE